MSDQNSNHEHDTASSNVPGHEPAENRIDQGIRSFTDRIADLFRQGNRRRFQLNNAQGNKIFSLPLTITVLIGLFLLWRLPFLVVIAVVVALVMKMQFVLTRSHDVEIVEPNGE
jgi:hypothetical protein